MPRAGFFQAILPILFTSSFLLFALLLFCYTVWIVFLNSITCLSFINAQITFSGIYDCYLLVIKFCRRLNFHSIFYKLVILGILRPKFIQSRILFFSFNIIFW